MPANGKIQWTQFTESFQNEIKKFRKNGIKDLGKNTPANERVIMILTKIVDIWKTSRLKGFSRTPLCNKSKESINQLVIYIAKYLHKHGLNQSKSYDTFSEDVPMISMNKLKKLIFNSENPDFLNTLTHIIFID